MRLLVKLSRKVLTTLLFHILILMLFSFRLVYNMYAGLPSEITVLNFETKSIKAAF